MNKSSKEPVSVFENYKPNTKLDLVIERVIDVPREMVWDAWTKPEHLVHWFTPKPWSTESCDIDVRPGGRWNSVMKSPEGELFPNVGCYLEVKHQERLVFTDALGEGFRPTGQGFMTAIVQMVPHGTGTKYTAIAIHHDEEARKKHEEMGFFEGWNAALDQLVAYVKSR